MVTIARWVNVSAVALFAAGATTPEGEPSRPEGYNFQEYRAMRTRWRTAPR